MTRFAGHDAIIASRFRSYSRFSFGPPQAEIEAALGRLEEMIAAVAK